MPWPLSSIVHIRNMRGGWRRPRRSGGRRWISMGSSTGARTRGKRSSLAILSRPCPCSPPGGCDPRQSMGPVTGWSAVSEMRTAAASRFRNGRVSELDVLSGSGSEELAWYHEIERGEAMLGGRSELEPFALRVTTVYRREDDEWRIVLRHADPIVEARPPDASLSSGTGHDRLPHGPR